MTSTEKDELGVFAVLGHLAIVMQWFKDRGDMAAHAQCKVLIDRIERQRRAPPKQEK